MNYPNLAASESTAENIHHSSSSISRPRHHVRACKITQPSLWLFSSWKGIGLLGVALCESAVQRRCTLQITYRPCRHEMAAVFAVAGIAAVGVLSVVAYRWWNNTFGADDDDIEVRTYKRDLCFFAAIDACVAVSRFRAVSHALALTRACGTHTPSSQPAQPSTNGLFSSLKYGCSVTVCVCLYGLHSAWETKLQSVSATTAAFPEPTTAVCSLFTHNSTVDACVGR